MNASPSKIAENRRIAVVAKALRGQHPLWSMRELVDDARAVLAALDEHAAAVGERTTITVSGDPDKVRILADAIDKALNAIRTDSDPSAALSEGTPK